MYPDDLRRGITVNVTGQCDGTVGVGLYRLRSRTKRRAVTDVKDFTFFAFTDCIVNLALDYGVVELFRNVVDDLYGKRL